MDEELRALAFQSLQALVIDFPEWRHEVVAGRRRRRSSSEGGGRRKFLHLFNFSLVRSIVGYLGVVNIC